jgi:parvulin-like peptidyl-prolyl isomerase
MEMKTRLLFLSVLLALVAVVVAGCGGGGGSNGVPADSIASVNGTNITKATFNGLLDYGFAINYLSRGQQPPKVGTPVYSQLRDQAVSFLVKAEEFKQEGEKLGVTLSQKDIDARVALIRKTSFQGSEQKLEAALKKDHITLDELEKFYLGPQLLSQKLEAKVTANVKVSSAAALKYYNQNKASFTMPKTREVRHILVNSKSLAERIYRKLKNGASFAKLAKKYSIDTGTAPQGGKLCAAHGRSSGQCLQTVPPFDKAAFSLKTKEISKPVHSVDGWHIIQPLGPVNPAHGQTFKEVESQIQSNLVQQQQQVVWSAWVSKVPNDFKGKVAYQSGYEPPTTSTPTATAPTTTG